MPRLQGPTPFPFGVADAQGRFAFISLAGTVFVLSLADGRIVWQARKPWQPLLLGDGLAIAWEQQGPDSAAVAALEFDTSGSARECWRSEIRAGPVAVARAGAVAAMDDVTAAWCGDDVLVQWTVRERYAGGASPPSVPRAPALRECWRFTRSAGQATPLAAWPQQEATREQPAAVPAPAFEQRRYELNPIAAAEAGSGFRLIARSAADGSVAWQTTFDGLAVRRAPRPRP